MNLEQTLLNYVSNAESSVFGNKTLAFHSQDPRSELFSCCCTVEQVSTDKMLSGGDNSESQAWIRYTELLLAFLVSPSKCLDITL